jgi:integrase
MSRAPGPLVQVMAVQDRRSRGTRRPWVVRWKVAGMERSKSFSHRAAAEGFRSKLHVAAQNNETFSTSSGLPNSWDVTDETLATWTLQWIRLNWPTWQPKTRRSEVEAVSRLLRIAVTSKAPAPPATVGAEIRCWLIAGATDEGATCPVWLSKHSLRLAELTKAVCLGLDGALTTKLDGHPQKANTANRYRRTARAMLAAAVDVELLPSQPWPAGKKGRKRNAEKLSRRIDTSRLPGPDTVRMMLAAMPNHQSASHTYHVLSALVYFGGLRPSEAMVIDVSDITLPPTDDSWGEARVWRADKNAGAAYASLGEEPNDTKTGDERTVPLVPELVAILRPFIGDRTSGPLTLTRLGNVPSASNWGRAWRRVRTKEWCIYDLRHACASLWLASGVPAAEVAEILGHSVDVLLNTYADCLEGGLELAKERILAALQTPPLVNSK